MLSDKSQYIWKCSYDELIQREITGKVSYIFQMKENKEWTTHKIYRKLKKTYDPNISYRTVLRCLNTMEKYKMVNKRIDIFGNTAYWTLGENAMPKELLIAERDKRLINYFTSILDSIQSNYDITLYGFPNEIIDKSGKQKIDELLKKMRNISHELGGLRRELVFKYLLKINLKVSNLDVILVITHFLATKEKQRKWFGSDGLPKTVDPDLELVGKVKEYFPLKAEGEIYQNLQKYEFNQDVYLDIINVLGLPLVMPTLVVAHLPGYPSMFIEGEEEIILEQYKERAETLKLSKDGLRKTEKNLKEMRSKYRKD